VAKWLGPDAGTFIAAGLLAAAAGFLELSTSRPPRIELTLGGFFALTVGSVALRGLTTLDGGHPIQGFSDIRDHPGAHCRRRPAPGRRDAPAAHRSAASVITKDLYTYIR
jgi:hypothetical protein